MRFDMAKVIVERPRLGSRLPSKGKGYERRTRPLLWDQLPRHERMKERGGRRKFLNEHLAPLRRYLAGNVGRPWDKVFADVCRYLDRNSAVQDHVRDHLEDYVAINVLLHQGQLCHGDGYGIGQPLRSLFYVCPQSGILKKNRLARRWHFRPKPKLRIHFCDDGAGLVRKDGVWLIIEWQTIPKSVKAPGRRDPFAAQVSAWDVLQNANLDRDEAERIYGRPIHAVSVRRANKREIRTVVNSYPHTNVL